MYVDGSERDVGCIQSGQAAYNFSLGADRWDILGVSIESLGVSEYLIFDLKRTSFLRKLHFCTASVPLVDSGTTSRQFCYRSHRYQRSMLTHPRTSPMLVGKKFQLISQLAIAGCRVQADIQWPGARLENRHLLSNRSCNYRGWHCWLSDGP